MSSSQGYTVEPPSYTPAAPAPPAKKGANAYGATAAAADAAHEPLLAPGEGHAARDAWGEDDDGLDDDFKVCLSQMQAMRTLKLTRRARRLG